MSRVVKINRLNNLMIKQAKPKEKNYTLTDGAGLQLLVKTSGSKLWEFYYLSPTKKKRRKTSFGTYPDVTIQVARDKRKEFKELISKGIDPLDYLKEQKQLKIKNFNEVIDEFLEMEKENLVYSTYKTKKNLFDNYVKPYFINRDIKTIKHPEIVKLLQDKAKKAPETANRLYNYLDNLFRYATTKAYCDFNIITNIYKPAIIKQTKTKSYPKINDIDILKNLIKVLYNENNKIHISTKNSLLFVLHIPIRAYNLINLKWDYIDFDNRTLTIPRSEMKNKNENIQDYKIYLTDEVIRILKNQFNFSGGGKYIFVNNNFKPISQDTPNRYLKRLGFNDEKKGNKQRLHSFRGTFRSLAETYQDKHKIDTKIQEIILDHHEKNKAVLAYTNKVDYLKQIKKLMIWWSDFILELKNK